MNCPIWKTVATVEQRPDGQLVKSPRAGGVYEIAGTAEAQLGSLSTEDRLKLSTWIINNNLSGVLEPCITSYTLEDIKEQRSFIYRTTN